MSRWRDIYTLLEVEKQKGRLSKKEKKRLIEFKEKKDKLDALPHQPCEKCGRLIVCPTKFCSSKCKEKCNK